MLLNGHEIPDEYADLFFDGRTGEPISDEAWDEQIRRIREHEPEFKVA